MKSEGIQPGSETPIALLLVDDDVELCVLMKEYFTLKGFCISCAYNGRDGLTQALGAVHDLVILDGMLPVLDGFEVLRQLRRHSEVPVIMLTARAQERDRIEGLECGADDYIPKPFGADELLARVRAVLRRSAGRQNPRPETLVVGDITLEPATGVVRRAGLPVALTSMEVQVLELLMRSAGRIVTRDEVCAVLYQRKATPYERSLDVHISHLRKKIESGKSNTIRSIRGAGYLFSAGGK